MLGSKLFDIPSYIINSSDITFRLLDALILNQKLGLMLFLDPHVPLIPLAHNGQVNCNTIPRYMYSTLEHKVPLNMYGLHGISW